MRALQLLVLPALLASCASSVPRGVRNFANVASHVSGPVRYPQEPPVGGAHSPSWQNCGVYDRPLSPENAVHSLEHGAVWVVYRQELAVDQVQQLQEAVKGRRKILLSPWPNLRSPVILVAWNAELDLDSTTDEDLGKFIQHFAGSASAPEPGAPCSGGVGRPS